MEINATYQTVHVNKLFEQYLHSSYHSSFFLLQTTPKTTRRLKYKRCRRQTQKAMAVSPVIKIDDENVVAASGECDVTVEANVVDDVIDTVPASADDSLDSDEEVALINDL